MASSISGALCVNQQKWCLRGRADAHQTAAGICINMSPSSSWMHLPYPEASQCRHAKSRMWILSSKCCGSNLTAVSDNTPPLHSTSNGASCRSAAATGGSRTLTAWRPLSLPAGSCTFDALDATEAPPLNNLPSGCGKCALLCLEC
jgi:hypothetical protein